MQRFIVHIDMNSYFATVEQQLNPIYRGKPIVIGGSEGTRSVVVAASIEAKKYGIKVGMRHIEARQLCPQVQFVKGHPKEYSRLTQIFVDICKQYTDRIDVYSIDEVFLDMTGWCKNLKQVCEFVNQIKKEIRQKLGEVISCSAGIGPNRMIAKLASNMKKPDGLTIIKPEEIQDLFKWIEITDIPGIGPRLKIRLYDMGILTLNQLGKFPVTELQHQFGPIMGKYISDMGKGIDHSIIPYIDEYDETKSMGHRHTLPHDTVNRDEIYSVLLRLSEQVGQRMRRDGYQGRRAWVYLRWGKTPGDDTRGFSGYGEGMTLKHYIDDGYELYKIGRSILDRWQLRPVRLVGTGLTLLSRKSTQLKLFNLYQKEARLLKAQDIINTKYGKTTVQRARSLPVQLKTKIGGFKEPNQFDVL